jgi:hypothetical protein
MIITYKKGLKLNGKIQPCFMVMEVLILTRFSIANAVWMENEAFTLYLTCGRRIWKNGMMQELKTKAKCIDDFIAAAEYLIAQNILLPISCHSWGVKWRFSELL